MVGWISERLCPKILLRLSQAEQLAGGRGKYMIQEAGVPLGHFCPHPGKVRKDLVEEAPRRSLSPHSKKSQVWSNEGAEFKEPNEGPAHFKEDWI